MNPDNQQPGHDFGASLPLPAHAKPADPSHTIDKRQDEPNPAADLIRRKVQAAYGDAPDAAEEALDVEEMGPQTKRTKHQQFIYDLTNSGRPLAEIQDAWKEYYAGLPDADKHQVWQDFYAIHAQASHYAAAQPALAPESKLEYEEIPMTSPVVADGRPKPPKRITKSLADLRDMALGSVNQRKKVKTMQHVQSLMFGLGMGSIVVVIFLFSFFNERFIAPFVQPSRNVNNIPIIASGSLPSANPEVVIPKINVEIPVVYDVNTINDNAVETALERGVVHYADTAAPGQDGNVVIVGHSSNNIFNPGKYKFAFVLLSHLDNGDIFYLDKDGKRFTYQVYKKEIVNPNDVSVLRPTDKSATATLITCDPPGTSINRLVVVGEQISPDIASNTGQTASASTAATTAIIPGNSPTLWSRMWKWFTG